MVVVVATTLGDTLVELQLFEWTLFVKRKSNTSRSIVQFSVRLGFHTCLVVRCSTCQALGRLTHIPSQVNIFVLIRAEGYIIHK